MPKPTFASLLLLPAFVGACAVSMEDSGSNEAEVAVGKLDAVCGATVPSSDGRYVLSQICFGTTPVITRMTVVDGAQRRVAGLKIGDTVRELGITADVIWFTTIHKDKTWDLTLQDAALVRPPVVVKPAFSAGITVQEQALSTSSTDNVVVTPDGQHVVVRSGTMGRFLIAARVDGTAPATVIDRGTAGPSYTLVVAPDSSHVLVSSQYAAPQGHFARLDLSGAVPVLGPLVKPQLDRVSLRLASYDGASLFAIGTRPGVPGSVVASVDVATGVATVLSEGFQSVSTVGQIGPHYWYTAARTVSGVPRPLYTIERVTRGGASPRVTLTSRTEARFEPTLSTRGKAVLYRTGRIGEAMELFTVPSDGSAPHNIYNRGGDLLEEDSAGGRTVFLERRAGERNHLLVDDASGIVESWPIDDANWGASEPRISSDGKFVYASRVCNVGALKGHEVVRFGAADEVLLPCSIASSRTSLVAIPESSAIVALQPQASASGSRSQLVLLQP